MYKAKLVLRVSLIAAGITLCLLGARSFADDAALDPNNYSNKDGSTIGAWYDESWQASGFYRLEQVGSSNNFHYEYTANPAAGSSPTYVKPGESKQTVENTSPPTTHTHSYTASPASLPQDIVVTEWKTTGHVHFSSGI